MSAQPLLIGADAPDFTLPSDTGKPVGLSEFRGKRVILYFYPKDDTTGCTTQACGFRDHYPEILERNAVVLGVSPDSAESHRRFKTKFDLPFILLVDADHRVAQSYGAWSGSGMVRSHFVIDEKGVLEDIQVHISPADSVDRAVKAVIANG